MYHVERDILQSGRRLLTLPRVSRTVVLLGMTSLFTDISSEMISAVLPLYLIFGLGLTPFTFGIVDGLYQGAAALVRIAAGVAGDRWRRHKEIATAGYALSAVCKLAFLAVGSAWAGIGAVILAERTGKGIRTAPRDALISLSSPRAALGTAFGVHRALDTTGAMIGPLVAAGLLALASDAYDAVFVVSFCFAILGVGVIGLFVQNQAGDLPEAAETVSLRAAAGLLLDRRFRAITLAGAALALATIGDAFVYLGLQRQVRFTAGYFPLLYVGTALVYMTLAMPVGQLADRIGRGRVFLGGHLLLLVCYGALLVPALGVAQVPVILLALGTYYAATDGVLMALASSLLPDSLRGSGLALVTTATTLARLLASVLFGALWTWRGIETALPIFAGGLVLALLCAARALIDATRRGAAGEGGDAPAAA